MPVWETGISKLFTREFRHLFCSTFIEYLHMKLGLHSAHLPMLL